MPLAVLSLAAAALLAASPAADAGAKAVASAGAGSGGEPASDGSDGSSSETPPTLAGPPAARLGAAEAAARPSDGPSWFAFPVVFWLPETKLGVGGAAGVHFHVAKGAGDSNAFLVAGYTLLGQGTVDLSSDVMLPGGTLLTGRLRFAYYPDTFYGIGPNTSVDQREDLTRRFAETILAADFPIVRNLRAGPRVHARAERIVEATPGGLVATGQVPGADGFDALGLGVQATWDTRDNPLWTTRGTYVQAWYLKYPSSIGFSSGFYRGFVEGRLFLPFPHGRVLGFGAVMEHADASTPFSILPKIGSTRYLRGIRDGRFRDAIAWAAQTELRVPFANRFAAALFGSFGDVAPTLSAQRLDTIKLAGGVGLRYRLTRQGANLRADAALSDEGGVEFYVLLLEAF